MKFDETLKLMKQGKKVKLPHWQGYWCWGDGTIHTRNGNIIDLFYSDNKDTLDNIANDKFEIIQEIPATIYSCLRILKTRAEIEVIELG